MRYDKNVLDEIFYEQEKIWNSFLNTLPKNELCIVSNGSYPKMNVIQTDDFGIEIEAAVPGLLKEDIDIDIDGDILTIHGISKQEDKKYLWKELKKSSFSRSIRLGKGLDSSCIKASFENGILKIVVPAKNKEQKTTKKVEIQ